jgi:hypothetical protein
MVQLREISPRRDTRAAAADIISTTKVDCHGSHTDPHRLSGFLQTVRVPIQTRTDCQGSYRECQGSYRLSGFLQRLSGFLQTVRVPTDCQGSYRLSGFPQRLSGFHTDCQGSYKDSQGSYKDSQGSYKHSQGSYKLVRF